MTDLKVGDIVHVRGKIHAITREYAASLLISFDCGRDYARATPAEIVRLERRCPKIGVGSTIQSKNDCCHGTVLAIDGVEAWVKWYDGRRSTVLIIELIPV